MNYNVVSSSIIESEKFLSDRVVDISEIKFSGNWSGAASEKLLLDLKDSLDKINILNSNLKIYSSALKKVQEIVIIDKEIDDLTLELSGLDENKNALLIAAINARINELNKRKISLKAEVNSLLSSITLDGSLTDSNVVDSLYAKMTLDEKKFALAEEKKKQQSEKNEDTQEDSENNDLYSSNIDESTSVNKDYTVLDAKMGFNPNGPSGSETFCPDQPVGAIKIMMNSHGYSNLELYYRDDGVTLVRGIDPDGNKFEDLVAVAADIYDEPSGHTTGIFERGEIVETSLGTAMIVDYCERAENMRKADGSVHFDIYTGWWDKNERWYYEIYGSDK